MKYKKLKCTGKSIFIYSIDNYEFENVSIGNKHMAKK